MHPIPPQSSKKDGEVDGCSSETSQAGSSSTQSAKPARPVLELARPVPLATTTEEPARPVSEVARSVPLVSNVADSSPIELASVDDAIDPMNDE